MTKTKKLSKTGRVRIWAAINATKVPDGWRSAPEVYEGKRVVNTREWSHWEDPMCVSVVYRREDGEAEVVIRYTWRRPWRSNRWTVSGDGSTWFKFDGSWYTFDRHGIDDSFSIGGYGYPDATVALEGEDHRIEKRVEARKDMTRVPGFPVEWNMSGPRQAECCRQLAEGGRVTFTPYGFGTGYYLTTRRPRGRYGIKRASPETCSFFGVDQLWLEAWDAD